MSERPLTAPEVLDAARRAQDEFGLCDACLGRRWGKVETGLTNDQRGAIVREAAGVRRVAPADCFVCQGLSAETDLFARAAVEAMAPHEHATFLVGTRVDPAIEARDAEVNAALAIGGTAERIQAELNRETGKKVAGKTGKAVEFKTPELTAIVDTRFLDAELQHGGLCVFGRYRKLDRTIPQTRWPCRRCQGNGCVECHGTGKQYATSVEEIVAIPFLEASGATEESFHGAGREDIDARTLGRGRPFILELKDPRVRALDLAPFPALVKELSGGAVEIGELRFAPKSEIAGIKEHRGSKTYRALVDFGADVSDAALRAAVEGLRGATIQQRTPQRVEHRRGDLVRERRVLGIEVESHEGAVATLRIHGDAGLYIKELVSSDEGRTEPSLSGLLGLPAKVRELDIVDVEYEAPSSA